MRAVHPSHLGFDGRKADVDLKAALVQNWVMAFCTT